MDTESVVRAYVEACNSGDLEAVLSLLDPAVELHEAEALPGAVSAVGLDEVRRYLERFGAHWTSFEWEPTDLIVEGDRALMHARLRLTGRESGIDVDRAWSYLFTVRNGKLLRQDGYDDRGQAAAAFSARAG